MWSRRALLCVALLPLASAAGPQVNTDFMSLQMLDLNGTPFRYFHLQHYSNVLATQNMGAQVQDPFPVPEMDHLLEEMQSNTGVHGFQLHLSAPDEISDRTLDINDLDSLREASQ